MIDTDVSSSVEDDLVRRLVPWTKPECQPTPASLTLADCLEEIGGWLRHPRDTSWARAFKSLTREVDASEDSVGPELAAALAPALRRFSSAVRALGASADAASRVEVAAEGDALLAVAVTPTARRAAWRDLVSAIRSDTSPEIRSARSRQLFALLRHAGVDVGWHRPSFQSVLLDSAYDIGFARGRDWDDIDVGGRAGESASDRIALCEDIAGRMPDVGRCVVWLSYEDARIDQIVQELGPVMLTEARWAIPNAARADGQSFPFRDELARSDEMRIGLATDPMIADERRVVLARVDLGVRTRAGAMADARKIVETLVDVAAFHGSGARWTFHGWSILIVDGRQVMSSLGRADTPTGTIYDLDHTAAEITERGGRLAAAMASRPLPPELDEALRSRTAAANADARTKLIMSDRTVEMVASCARQSAARLASLVASTWPEARARGEIINAFEHALHEGEMSGRRTDANRVRKAVTSAASPGRYTLDLEAMSQYVEDLLSLAVGSDQAERISTALRRLTDPAICAASLSHLDGERDLLSSRLRRVRNALMHGNPASPTATTSVTPFATYLAEYALDRALDAFTTGGSLEDRIDRDVESERQLRLELAAGVPYLQARHAP